MTTKTKRPKAADDDHDDDGGDDHDDDDHGSSSDDALVDRVVEKVLAALGDVGGSDDDTGDDGGGDDRRGTRSPASVEHAAEDAVRRAMGQLRADEARDSKIKELETKVEDKIKESAPVAYRRLTAIMWGGDR